MFRFLTIPKNIKSKTKQKQQKPLNHFSFLRRIFGKAFLDLFLPWSNPAEDYIQRSLSKYLQKVQLSSEKQINWDRLVNLPESPSAALLLQCKEKAKHWVPPSCHAVTSQQGFQTNAGSYMHWFEHFFSSILASFRLLEQDV